jgi:hypothetical protein
MIKLQRTNYFLFLATSILDNNFMRRTNCYFNFVNSFVIQRLDLRIKSFVLRSKSQICQSRVFTYQYSDISQLLYNSA